MSDHDDDRRLGRLDLALVLAWGPFHAAWITFALLLFVGARDLVQVARQGSPFTFERDELVLGTVAGGVLLATLVAAGAWRAMRGPVRELSRWRAVGLTGAGLIGAWFWLVLLAGVLA